MNMKSRNSKKNALSASNYFVLDDETPFSVREAYKSIRTNLLSIFAVSEGPKQICFTSPEMSDGKSTTCANVAAAFAQTGARVLVVDADLRRPKVHRIFKKNLGPGLADCLVNSSLLQKAIVSYKPIPGLDVLPAGKIPPNPTELILSERFDEFLASLIDVYDYVFLDAPPVCLVTDPVIISKKTLGAVLVCRYGKTKREAIKKAKDEILRGSGHVIGTLLNGVDYGHSSGYSKYGSKYGYKYGYYNSNSTDSGNEEH